MKSSTQSTEPDNKKRYVFFSDPDLIAKRAETSAVAAQIKRDFEAQQQVSKRQSVDLPASTLGIKSLENLLSYHPVQPYPFTFISAVKQKLALGGHSSINTRTYIPSSQANNGLTSSLLKTNCIQNSYQARKMDFIRPLKVPDLKISPKTLDFSSRESSVSKELPSAKLEIVAKEFAHDRSDKSAKIGDRVQRKLDFSSSDGPSTINCESIEPLKAPNVSIASNLSKKKEHARDSSREKENRSKRIKKDDSLCTKRDESGQDQAKRSRSPRHVSRRDAVDSMSGRLKNDRLPFHMTKNNDSLATKSKVRNFITSTAKKDGEVKKQRSFNVQSELTRDIPLEPKSRTCSNKALDFLSSKVPDKIITRDNSNMAILFSNIENKSKDHLRQVEDLKYKCDSDNRQVKQEKGTNTHKEPTKRIFDKSKTSSSKIEGKIYGVNSEPSEDVEYISDTNSYKNRGTIYPVTSVQQSKSKEPETTMESKQNVNSVRSAKTSENFKYMEHSSTQSASTSTKKDEDSYSESSIVTIKQTTTNDDTNDADVSALPEALYDPRRISFRDNSYSQQEEFPNLSTPENIDVTVKSKQRRYLMQNNDSEVDARCPKYKPIIKSEIEQEMIQLMHPTALHMQFQAELHLLDSFNESIRHVMEVEKSMYNTKSEQEPRNSQKGSEKGEEIQVGESRVAAAADSDLAEKTAWKPLDCTKKEVTEAWKSNVCDNDPHFIREHHIPSRGNIDETVKVVKVAEVQTQTVNDVATQTDTFVDKRNTQNRSSEIRENVHERSFLGENEAPQLSLESTEQFEDLCQTEDVSLPSKIRTMSEISLHETTSSIRTETGTEISISTRDVTFKSNEFNNYLSQEMAQLIKDEEQRKDRVDMYFKSYQKTLNDKTKKLAKLEEQKRALRDTGQDSRVSSVKKKQRAIILKIQEEKEKLIKMKEVHEIFSQERNSMFQKQRDTFNPQMSTKNILTKLKRSADSQSPRRLSGPMKGYDIRSNSSISSLIDSDKSQHDRSQVDTRMQASESDVHISKLDSAKSDKSVNLAEESNTFDELAEINESHEKSPLKLQKDGISKYELKSRKYDEKMPRADVLRLKQSQLDMESKRIQDRPMKIKRLLENQRPIEISPSSRPELDPSAHDYVKSESDTLVEELSKRSRMSQVVNPSVQSAIVPKEEVFDVVTANSESIQEETNSKVQDTALKVTKSSQVSEDVLQTTNNKNCKKIDKTVASDRDVSKKLQHNAELRSSVKRKSSKYQKTKSSSSVLTENILRSKSSSYLPEELIKHYDKRTRTENEVLDDNNESSILGELESQDSFLAMVNQSKTMRDKNAKLLSEIVNDCENVSGQPSNRKLEDGENLLRNERIAHNVSTSQIRTFAISHHSSEESEKNLSRSVVVRPQNKNIKLSKKLEELLTTREAALASRKNCIEGWLAWYTRLKTEEQNVRQMEQALLKVVATTSNVLSQQGNDTTFSSDTSDVEGRIEILTEKMAKRRIEMTRLKREVKNQAKQKLHALEAHLENQIQGYDMTILKLRKMLESKKAVKDRDKLAIEPKSLAEFKVPEIPLKRIQDIYKNSDLLRSRSESDLLSTRNQLKDSLSAVTYGDRHERNGSQKSTKLANVKSASVSGWQSATDANHSVQSVSEEYTATEARDKLRTATSMSSNDATSEKYTASTLGTDQEQESAGTKQNSVSRDAEDIQTIISTARSEAQTISDAKSSEDRSTINTESASERLITRTSIDQPKSQSEILEEAADVDYSKSVPSKSDCTTESDAHVSVAASNRDILSFSKKVDFLQLNNRNLSENISSVENGVKTLLSMMSHFSNKTNEITKNNATDDERSTSQDISEIISRSVLSDRILNVEDEEKETVSSERKIESPVSTNDRKSRSFNDLSPDEYIAKRGNSEVSAVIAEEASTVSNSPQEIDYEARSKEIMNEIEKSIISEHNKVARGDYNVSAVLENDMQNFHKDNEELLNDLVTLESDVESISEILSKVSESKKSLDLIASAAARIIDDSEGDANAHSDLNDAKKLEENLTEKRARPPHLSRLAELSSVKSTHSPIIAGHRTKESRKTNLQRDAQSTYNSVMPNKNARTHTDDLESSEDIPEVLESETSIADDSEVSRNFKRDGNIQVVPMVHDDEANSTALASNVDQDRSRAITVGVDSQDRGEWTTSDSFEIPQDEISTGEGGDFADSISHSNRMDDTNLADDKIASRVDDATNRETETNLSVNASTFIPRGESTNIVMHDVTFDDVEPYAAKSNDVLDDILDIIARESDHKQSVPEKFSDSVIDLLDRVENNARNVDTHFEGILCDNETNVPADNRSEAIVDRVSMLNNKTQSGLNAEDTSEGNVVSTSKDDGTVDAKPAINIDLNVEISNEDESLRETTSEVQEIIITELDSDSMEDHVLPELEIDAKVELAEDEESVGASDASEKQANRYDATDEDRGIVPVEIQEYLEPILEQEDSSDGEQLDNLVEIAESGLDTVEKLVAPSRDTVKSTTVDGEASARAVETREEATGGAADADTSRGNDEIADNINKTFDILKDPDYEDISEESLEVSEILDKNEPAKATVAKKPAGLPVKYRATQKSEEVLRILDEISQKSSPDSTSDSHRNERDARSVTEEVSEVLGAEISAEDNISPAELKRITEDRLGEGALALQEKRSADRHPIEERSGDVSSGLHDEVLDGDKSSRIIYELRERVSRLQEQDGSSESSEAGDTPRGVPEIELDSPRDFNDSRLDIDILDDDLLSVTKTGEQGVDVKTNFHSASIVTTSEKDIEAMIDKLKASLEQPGLEVAELEAKLLRIEQLQIELEIKKLEAEEVSYYVREIPNKPPPPYTPPGDGRLSTSLGSPSLLTAVIPSNVEELTSFTEKATALIYNAKLAGEDIAGLEAPAEIYELNKEEYETARKDRRIYNTFLFDLCKETIAEVYRAEYEKPGPSWTKPNVKTKPTMKVPRTVEELTEYVSKEVATLFGFKTKLQRENMVMRWSRKRRDRVDELLAREAQAEEDEWTKFHHDELAVKNGLTVAILDTLVMETANVVKIAYARLRKMLNVS